MICAAGRFVFSFPCILTWIKGHTMRHKLLAIAVTALAAVAAMHPAPASARVVVGVGVGGCCYGPGYGYYHGYYPGYYPYYAPYYYAPPPVVVAAPPAPQIIYAPAPAAMPADQTSPTFIDNLGRTCRQYQAGNGATGTACLQPDGTWRTIN